MPGCPCASLRRGAACLAVTASFLAQPQIFFGGPFVQVATAALHGTATLGGAAGLISWLMMAATGLIQSLQGYRAALSHNDYFDPTALVKAGALGGFCIYLLYAGWTPPLEWGVIFTALSRSALLAGAAYNAAGLYLQLRGPLAALFVGLNPWPKRQNDPTDHSGSPWGQPPAPDDGAAAQLAEHRAALADLAQEVDQNRQALIAWQETVAAREQDIAERDRAITAVVAERDHFADQFMQAAARGDRFQAKGKKLMAEVKQLRTDADELRNHADAIRKLPGGFNAIAKALHPDSGPAGDHAARTEIFKLVALIYKER